MMPLFGEELAKAFAVAAHSAIGQRRARSGGEPYWRHPERVVELVRLVAHDPFMLAAAWLHDVVEDTQVTASDLSVIFPQEVVGLVVELTDCPTHGSRAERKRMVRERLSAASDQAKTIKLADIADNARCMRSGKPDFADRWIAEKRLLLPALRGGNGALWDFASAAVDAT